ncbi:hypothetical protein KIN20_019628 [Parelaphostrongylus tenuis]|uniref:Ribosomal RNA-processing protein 42 n=1 Tax=Parelaphostrongylus tenuis TaxID=148309 RepID=A0AAD5N2E6_PARTN|nr:hypothetical protein KIN20_019628 [Parelaphostrongylus tenuis]
MLPALLGDFEKTFIIRGFAERCRTDGRDVDDYRPIWIESSVLHTTNGSARVKIGTTDILVGVKCQLIECEDTSEESNQLRFTVEPSLFIYARARGKTVRSFARSIRMALEAAYNGGEGAITNMNRLILSNKFMWRIYVDVVILQHGGNVVDAVFIAVKAALSDTKVTQVRVVVHDEHLSFIHCDRSTGPNFFRLEAAHAPLAVTVNQIGDSIAVDCTTTEEAAVRTALWVVMDRPENARIPDDQIRLRLIKQMGAGGIDPCSIPEMIDFALKIGRELHTAVKSRLEVIRNSDSSQVGSLSFHTG